MKRNIMFIIAAALSAAAIAALPAAAAQKGRLEDATGQPAEKIVFATTTPMNTNGKLGGNPCTTESIRRYNAAAVAVTQAEDVAVNDLFAITEKWPISEYADYCHFTKPAAKRLGGIVADRLAAEAEL